MLTPPDIQRISGWLLKPLIAVVALVLVFEEWLWDALKAQLHRLSGLPTVHRLECWLQALPPWASLGVMVVPALALLPFKLAALWALARGHLAGSADGVATPRCAGPPERGAMVQRTARSLMPLGS